ncbi:uncharacterized protein LOC143226380 isoform X1 [Tachypleus tridentatus]|uniref:uncharacterized protein LOC143226380 isoform X1 n=1 Tax=Tachypleus tridentatus TaxID=6853 RepID=UPI003FCEF7E4
MDDTDVGDVDDPSKEEDPGSSLPDPNVPEVIGLLLSQSDHQEDSQDNNDNPHAGVLSVCPSEGDSLAINCSVGSPVIAVTTSTPPLSISGVALSDSGISLVDHRDVATRVLETRTVKLENGTTAFVQSLPSTDESDSSEAPTKFFDGQAVQLEDGTTAFIHTTPREGLQTIQLEDGTTAYISPVTAEPLFDGEASGLGLENFAVGQIGEDSVSEGARDGIEAKMALGVVNSPSTSSPRALAMGDRAFKCPYEGCGRLYTTQHHLKVHERSHTGYRPFKCNAPGCHKAFATGYGLKSHTRVHTGETPYKCPDEQCHKAFKTSGDLQKHVRTHTGERPFKCPFEGCDRAFTTSNIRKVHIRTHTGERPYICKEEGCGRSFASATNYKNHIRIHTGEKPYVCSVLSCGKKFTEYSSLYKHHVVHTLTKPYVCNLCGKNYRQTSTLAMHRRTVHGIVEEEMNIEPTVSISEERSLVGAEESGEEAEIASKQPRLQFRLGGSLEDGTANLVIQGTTSQHIAMLSSVSDLPNEATVIALQGNQSVNEQGVQQILVVADPAQLAALQQLAQQQFAQVLSPENSADGGDSISNRYLSGKGADGLTLDPAQDPKLEHPSSQPGGEYTLTGSPMSNEDNSALAPLTNQPSDL